MKRSTLIALVVVILVVVAGLFSFGYLGNDGQGPAGQPSPHALDQSQ